MELPFFPFMALGVFLVASLLFLIFLLLDLPLGASHPLRHVVLQLLQILV